MKNKTHNVIKLNKKSLNRLKKACTKLINNEAKILILHNKKEFLREKITI